VACQCGTSGRRVGSSGGSEVVGAMLRGDPGAGAEGEQKVEVKAEAEVGGEAGGVSLTITPPPDEHQLNAEESEIRRKGMEPKVRVRM